jgi:hypothetical protein
MSAVDRDLPSVDAALAALLARPSGHDSWVRITNEDEAVTVERLSARWGEAREAAPVHSDDSREVFWDVAVDDRRHVVVTAELTRDSAVRWLRLVEYSL